MATIPVGTKFLGVDPNFTDLTERKGSKVDRKSEYFTLDDITATIGAGSQGPEGPEGPAGPPGPVGPAGLEWQGAWDTDSSYAEDIQELFFNDGSKIDIMIVKDLSKFRTIEINKFNFLKLNEIIYFKGCLLKNFKHIHKNNKHLQDISSIARYLTSDK